MNFQTSPTFPSLKVLVVNPLTPTGQMVTVKILSGLVFGEDQLVDLILLVYSNEKPMAERMKIELIECAYCCYNTIIVSSDLPSVSDADVFCFISNFYNLNKIELDKVDNDEQFDALYLIIKIANNFSRPVYIKEEPDDGVMFVKKTKKPEIKRRKPIFMVDGLAAMDVLVSLAKDMPHDVFFCPTPLPDIAKSVLGDYLKVQCNEINDVFVWAANDEVFHVEVENPMLINDQVKKETHCEWDALSKDKFRKFEFDHTQFSPSWMKKEFIEKVTTSASKNPYGCIFRATLFVKSLKIIWQSRRVGAEKPLNCCMGVISDGSLRTIKGHPYVLPLILRGETWSVNKRFEDTPHLRGELKRINKAVKEHHQILIPYCKKFLKENVINQSFLPVPAESTSEYSSVGNSSKTSIIMH